MEREREREEGEKGQRGGEGQKWPARTSTCCSKREGREVVCAVVNTVECACMPYSHGSFNLEGGLEREIEGLGRARRGGGEM